MITKVCGITREEDILACAELGVDMTGFIFHPSSPRYVQPQKVAGLPRTKAKRVGVFVQQTRNEILECMEKAKIDLAQLHGNQDPQFCRAIGPDRVFKVLWPQKYPHAQAMQKDLQRYASVCAFFVLDSGLKGGGHGQTVDTTWISELYFPRPWLLAGGLGPSTLGDVLRNCKPDGVDLNSGVETQPGVKDRQQIKNCLRQLAVFSCNSSS
jgi:phosphoribosylanthranilate isomerase